MTTILVWLLVSLPSSATLTAGQAPTASTIAQFADAAECQRVRAVLSESTNAYTNLRCVQARVVAQKER